MSEVRVKREAPAGAVAGYKAILKAVLENRPSGMRQKLAEAIGKNRSFVSQISNPAYQAPIPPGISPSSSKSATSLRPSAPPSSRPIRKLNPGRLGAASNTRHERKIAFILPDLGSPGRNQQLEALIFEFVHRLTLLIGEER